MKGSQGIYFLDVLLMIYNETHNMANFFAWKKTVWKICAFLSLTGLHPKILKIDSMLYQLKLTPWLTHRNKSIMSGMTLFLTFIRTIWYAIWWCFQCQFCISAYFEKWKRCYKQWNKHVISISQNFKLAVKNQNAPGHHFFFTPKFAPKSVDYQ